MAIKGKSKTRSAKTVTRGPKPTYVSVHRPLLSRRGFWLAIAAIVAVATIGGVWYGVAKESRDRRERDRLTAQADTLAEYRGQLEPVLNAIGQPFPPAGFSVLVNLDTAFSRLDGGEANLSQVLLSAEEAGELAKGAAEDLAGIEVLAMLRGDDLDPVFVESLIGSQEEMSDGLRLYERTAALLALSLADEDDPDEDLIEAARELHELARSVFDRGYADYVQAQQLAGSFSPVFPGEIAP